jgi:hypothetical protein
MVDHPHPPRRAAMPAEMSPSDERDPNGDRQQACYRFTIRSDGASVAIQTVKVRRDGGRLVMSSRSPVTWLGEER